MNHIRTLAILIGAYKEDKPRSTAGAGFSVPAAWGEPIIAPSAFVGGGLSHLHDDAFASFPSMPEMLVAVAPIA